MVPLNKGNSDTAVKMKIRLSSSSKLRWSQEYLTPKLDAELRWDQHGFTSELEE